MFGGEAAGRLEMGDYSTFAAGRGRVLENRHKGLVSCCDMAGALD